MQFGWRNIRGRNPCPWSLERMSEPRHRACPLRPAQHPGPEDGSVKEVPPRDVTIGRKDPRQRASPNGASAKSSEAWVVLFIIKPPVTAKD